MHLNSTGSKWDEAYLSSLEADANAVTDASKDNVYDGEASKSWIVETADNGEFTDGDMTVTVSGANANGHGAEVKATGTTVVSISLPAGSYILDAGTCKYGNADEPYVLTCANEDFKCEYVGTHAYSTEDCYNPGSGRKDLFGDIYFISSASDMTIILQSNGVKEYLPFIAADK